MQAYTILACILHENDRKTRLDRTSTAINFGNVISFLNSFVPNINNQSIVTDVTCNDGLWHHIALTWTADGGQWSLYKDGVKEVGGIDISTDKPIPGNVHKVLLLTLTRTNPLRL